ncbi:hypothetical protein D3C72_2407920 [compost metagenome]
MLCHVTQYHGGGFGSTQAVGNRACLGADVGRRQVKSGRRGLDFHRSLQHLGQRVDQRQWRNDQLGIDAGQQVVVTGMDHVQCHALLDRLA